MFDVLNEEAEIQKKDRLERYEDHQRHRLNRQRENLTKLMSEPWGREILWDFIIDAGSMKLNPYTRNADTYYILGMQRQAKLSIEVLKELNLSLYHKMELEANNRKKREEEFNG